MTPNCGESSKRFWPVSFGVWQPVQPSTCVRRLPCAMSADALVTCAPSKLISGGCAADWFSGTFEQAAVASSNTIDHARIWRVPRTRNSGRCGGGRALGPDHLAPDQHSPDLIRAGADVEQLCVAVIAFDWPVFRVSSAAQRLHRFVGDANGIL